VRVWRLPSGDADMDDPKHPLKGLPLGRVGSGVHPGVVTGIALDPATRSLWTSCLAGMYRLTLVSTCWLHLSSSCGMSWMSWMVLVGFQ